MHAQATRQHLGDFMLNSLQSNSYVKQTASELFNGRLSLYLCNQAWNSWWLLCES